MGAVPTPSAHRSRVLIRTVVTGLAEGGSIQSEFSQQNTTAVRESIETTAGAGVGFATPFTVPSDARFMLLQMPSTGRDPVSITASTAEDGITLSSQGASVLSVTGDSTFFVYTTASNAISGVRILFL